MPSPGFSASRRHEEPTSPEELLNLLRLAERDHRQAQVAGLDPDGRFMFAYNAALQLATAYLRLHGIRVSGQSRHAQTFHELQNLLPAEYQHFALEFERARRKRHALVYEQVGLVGESEVAALLISVEAFRDFVWQEIKKRHPKLDLDRKL